MQCQATSCNATLRYNALPRHNGHSFTPRDRTPRHTAPRHPLDGASTANDFRFLFLFFFIFRGHAWKIFEPFMQIMSIRIHLKRITASLRARPHLFRQTHSFRHFFKLPFFKSLRQDDAAFTRMLRLSLNASPLSPLLLWVLRHSFQYWYT